MVIKSGRGLKIKKAIGIWITPYLDNGILGSNTYDITSIVADSIELTQEDSEYESKYNECSNEPIIENTTRGNFNFSLECIDFSNPIMSEIYGYSIGSYNGVGVSGAVAFIGQNKPIYCAIKILFKDIPDILLSKVKLDSTINISNLKSKVASGYIKGKLFSNKCIIYKDNQCLDFNVNNEKTYNPNAQIFFIPKEYEIAFLYAHVNQNKEIYKDINNNIPRTVNLTNGLITN